MKPSQVDPHFQCVDLVRISRDKVKYNRFLLPNILSCLLLIKVKDFLELFDGHIGLYGQNRYTLDSLLLTIIPLCKKTVESSVDHCDLTGTERLLSCLMRVSGVISCISLSPLLQDML